MSAVGNWWPWVVLFELVALMLSSALALALRMPPRGRLEDQFERSGRASEFVGFLTLRPRYLMAAAVLRSMTTVALIVTTLALADRGALADGSSRLPAALVALALVLVFGVAIPNAWAKYSGEWLLVRFLPVLPVVRVVCAPVVFVLDFFDPLVRRLAGVPLRDAKSYADELEQEILDIVSEGERHGAVDEEEKQMIESVIELTDTRVEEIMTPRTEIVAISKDADLEQTLDLIRTKGHSRIPVYDGTIDKVVGALYAKDLLRRTDDGPIDLTKIMRAVLFIPESKPVRALLREFQREKVHIAVVLDEYGGTAGLVTIEDILEELVGEITDEYETSEPAALQRIDERTVEVDARMRIDDLNDELRIRLPEDGDFETIAGFVFSTFGKIPAVGERCEHDNVGILVVAAEPRRVTRVRLRIDPTNGDRRAEE